MYIKKATSDCSMRRRQSEVAYDGWLVLTWTVKGYYDVLMKGPRGICLEIEKATSDCSLRRRQSEVAYDGWLVLTWTVKGYYDVFRNPEGYAWT